MIQFWAEFGIVLGDGPKKAFHLIRVQIRTDVQFLGAMLSYQCLKPLLRFRTAHGEEQYRGDSICVRTLFVWRD